MSNYIKIALVGVLLVYAACGCGISIGDNEAELTELIEKGDFVGARKIADGYDQKMKVCRAQVADLISQGNYDMAAQIANEDKFYYEVYFESVFDNLTKIYTEQGEDKLLYILSNVTYPIDNEDNGWNKYSNSRLETFCDYLKINNQKDFISKVLVFLKPEYIREEGKNGDTYKWKADYSDSKRIKAKFGVK